MPKRNGNYIFNNSYFRVVTGNQNLSWLLNF